MIIRRKVQKRVEKALAEGENAIIVYGPRQAGKTTLVRQIAKNYAKDRVRYFNADYLSVRRVFDYEKAEHLGNVARGLDLIILDEAQRIENIGLTLKILRDEYPQLRVLATGSSSFELSNKVNEPLTGRKQEFHLYPFSLSEIVDSGDMVKQNQTVEHMLRFGGYPVAALGNEIRAEEYLKELTGSYLFKDIFTFQDLRRPELLVKLTELLALQIGQEVSYHELATQLGVDQKVIQRYILLLEAAFVVFRLSSLSNNPRKEISKKRKIYFYDLGVRNAILGNHLRPDLRTDKGALWENFCIAERMKYLEMRGISAKRYFWRTYTQKEVDYIEDRGDRREAYEFKWSQRKEAKADPAFLKEYRIDFFETVTRDNWEMFLGL